MDKLQYIQARENDQNLLLNIEKDFFYCFMRKIVICTSLSLIPDLIAFRCHKTKHVY